ncbi:hypothetical protein L345_00014, partial [Ophiophagus hannah]
MGSAPAHPRRAGAQESRQHVFPERRGAVPEPHRAARRLPPAGFARAPESSQTWIESRHRRGHSALGSTCTRPLDSGVHPAALCRLQEDNRKIFATLVITVMLEPLLQFPQFLARKINLCNLESSDYNLSSK